MSNIPRLKATLNRFNEGCRFYQQAINSWKNGNISEYETGLRQAATESIGALEWILKIYLRNIRRPQISADDISKLRQPNFNVLMELMEKYAHPPLDPETISSLYEYREQLRNPSEHSASLPPIKDLYNAILKVKHLILTYIPVTNDELETINEFNSPDVVLKQSKEKYFDMLRSQYQYMDLGGISPRVGGKVVKIRMEELFIPLEANEGEPLIESLSKHEFEEPFKTHASPDLRTEDLNDKLEEIENIQSSQFVMKEFRGVTQHQEGLHPVKVTQMLEKPRVVLLGHPGSGKTTVTRYIAYTIASQTFDLIGNHLEQHIPVIVKATEYALSLQNSNISFYDYLIQKHTSRFGALFKWALEYEQCLVIIDGLDEIPDAKLRVITARKINQFVNEFWANRFLVTSRIVGYRQSRLMGDFTHFTLIDFGRRQILEFIKQWYTAIETESGLQQDEAAIERRSQELWRAILANKSIFKLAGNPLLLTIIALANWRGTKLPNRRVELYQIATETLIENWPLKERGLTIDSEEVLAILAPIAHQIFTSGKNNLITEFELRPLFESQVCEVRGATSAEAKKLSRKIIKTIEEHTGVFLEMGRDQNGQSLYGFLHLTFAEYLTARFLAEQWSNRSLDLAMYAHDPRWYEVILLMAGHIGTWAVAQATRLVKDILELDSDYEDQLHRDLLLSAQILKDNVRIKRELQDEIVSRLISLALITQHFQLFMDTVQHLWEISKVFGLGNPTKLLQLRDGDSTDIKIRKTVISALIEEESLKNDVILSGLLQAIITNAHTIVPLELFFQTLCLMQEQDNQTHLMIIKGLNYENFYCYLSNEMANRILGLKPIIKILEVRDLIERPEDIKKESSRLWLIDPNELFELGAAKLASLLSSTEEHTQEVIDLIGVPFTYRVFFLAICDELLRVAISDDKAENRITALKALNYLFSIHSLELLEPGVLSRWIKETKHLFLRDDDSQIRSNALKLLRFLITNPVDWVNLLSQSLDDPDETVRLTTIEIISLYNPHPPRIIEKLRGLLNAPSTRLRQAIVRSLIRTGNFNDEDIPLFLKEAFRVPFNILNKKDLNSALYDLLRLSSKAHTFDIRREICGHIQSILQIETTYREDELNRHRHQLLELIEHIGDHIRKELAEDITNLFNSPNPNIRSYAADVWSIIRPTSTPGKLILSLLNHSDRNVSLSVIRGLHPTDIDDPDILPYLIDLLKENESLAAEFAARTLSKVLSPEIRQKIIDKIGNLIIEAPDIKNNKGIFIVLWNLMVEPMRSLK